MIRTLFEEILLPLLFFLLLRSVLGSLFRRPRQRYGAAPQPMPGRPPVQTGGDLMRDPVCGTYVSTAVSVTRTVKGRVLHFCSPECRDKFAG
jgi:uncharacterized protein